MFELLQTSPRSRARLGRLNTIRGVIDTPVFMPVGTQASVKALDLRELNEIGTEILLGNTYHLFLRPGMDIICLLYTSPSPRDRTRSRMPSSA